MPAERYYLPLSLEEGETAVLQNEEAFHLIKVMRGRPGDEVELVNGSGTLALAKVEKVVKESCELRMIKKILSTPPPAPIIIAQALPKLNRIDVIVEKGTELGMTELWFYPGDLSEKTDVSSTQQKRFANLAIAAMKQCGCLHLPKIEYKPALKAWPPFPFSSFFGDVAPGSPRFISALDKINLSQGIIFFIGPEKGFSPIEVVQLKKLGAQAVSLHPNILRTDTAPLCALSQIIVKASSVH